jgi:DNA-binding MarR family transcriptional regulator
MKQASKQNDQIVYKLHKTVFLLNRIADQGLQNSLSLTLPQFLILTAVSQYPGVSQLKVAQYLDLTQAAISKQMKLMLDQGLIERSENPKNRREHVLRPTAKGKKLLTSGTKVLDRKMSEVFESLSEPDRVELMSALEKITKRIYAKGIEYFCHC